jgi:hypothetical protein
LSRADRYRAKLEMRPTQNLLGFCKLGRLAQWMCQILHFCQAISQVGHSSKLCVVQQKFAMQQTLLHADNQEKKFDNHS